MNNKGFIEDINWVAASLAFVGAVFSFQYADYIRPDAGFIWRVFSSFFTLIVGYFVAWYILER